MVKQLLGLLESHKQKLAELTGVGLVAGAAASWHTAVGVAVVGVAALLQALDWDKPGGP